MNGVVYELGETAQPAIPEHADGRSVRMLPDRPRPQGPGAGVSPNGLTEGLRGGLTRPGEFDRRRRASLPQEVLQHSALGRRRGALGLPRSDRRGGQERQQHVPRGADPAAVHLD